MNREGFHDWRKEYERETIICISALCIGTCGVQQEAGRSEDPGANDRSSNDRSSNDRGTNDGSPDGACDVF